MTRHPLATGMVLTACLLGIGSIVGAMAQSPAKPPAEPPYKPTLSAKPARGGAPLSVTLTGDSGGVTYFGGIQIDFGDGTNALLCDPGRSCRNAKAQRTYETRGVFVARLVGRGEGSHQALASITIRVD